jgi:hypothetical protein
MGAKEGGVICHDACTLGRPEHGRAVVDAVRGRRIDAREQLPATDDQ